jgi:hypothetical protein
MAMYSFVTTLREAKFCGVPSCVFDKLGCAASEKVRGTLVYNNDIHNLDGDRRTDTRSLLMAFELSCLGALNHKDDYDGPFQTLIVQLCRL